MLDALDEFGVLMCSMCLTSLIFGVCVCVFDAIGVFDGIVLRRLVYLFEAF